MGFFIDSDLTLLRVVAWVGTLLLALTLLVLVLVLFLRAKLLLQEKRRQKFLDVWRPILVNAIEAPASNLPQIARRDLSDFLLVWNHLHESLLDESKDHLNQIADELNIGRVALRFLRRGNLRRRLLAILTLGQLRERAAWDALLLMARKEGALLSIVAARALVMIDAEAAAPELIQVLLRRRDWPAPRVATLLQTAGADVISDLIARAAIASSLEDTGESGNSGNVAGRINYATRLIRYLELTHRNSALPAVRTILQSSRNPQVLASCLRLLSTSQGLAFARERLAHEDWRVRVQAASALGRIGRAEDDALLIPLLSDRAWWVRYRAAQALSRLPGMGESKLKTIQAAQPNPFARDMLAQVMAEVQLL